jgi:ribonuclease HII
MEQCSAGELYTYDRACEKEVRGCIVGTDEAGRGPLAGPVVAAAVILDLAIPIEGVNDSKKLSPGKREALYEVITTRAKAWAVGDASPEEIDRYNILQASLLAMKRAIDVLGCAWSLVLVDGNQPIHGISPSAQRTVVGGDAKSASIAAASIIAKVTRDRLMVQYHDQYPAYGFDAHKGYPTAVHRSKVIEYGLTPIHRRSFCEKMVVQTNLGGDGIFKVHESREAWRAKNMDS